MSGTADVGIQLLEMLLEGYDVAAEQFALCARGLFSVAADAPAYQVSRIVGLRGIGEPPARKDVVDAEFAPVLLLRFSAVLASVAIASPDMFRAFLPV